MHEQIIINIFSILKRKKMFVWVLFHFLHFFNRKLILYLLKKWQSRAKTSIKDWVQKDVKSQGTSGTSSQSNRCNPSVLLLPFTWLNGYVHNKQSIMCTFPFFWFKNNHNRGEKIESEKVKENIFSILKTRKEFKREQIFGIYILCLLLFKNHINPLNFPFFSISNRIFEYWI